jgi:BrnA antitoxin of type II toxin-antitoxin system
MEHKKNIVKGYFEIIFSATDSDIDLSDVPEQRDWKDAKRGVFYKPIKQQLALRLNVDVVDWFKRQGEATKAGSMRPCARMWYGRWSERKLSLYFNVIAMVIQIMGPFDIVGKYAKY